MLRIHGILRKFRMRLHGYNITRLKISLIGALLIVILFFVTINSSSSASHSNEIERQKGILQTLSGWLPGQNGKGKTVPFANTGAATGSEFNNIISTTSDKEYWQMKDPAKLRLIKEAQKAQDPGEKLLKKRHEFYLNVFKVFDQGKPKIAELNQYLAKDRIYHARYVHGEQDNLIFSEDYLKGFLHLDDSQVASMKEAHSHVVKNLPDKLPENLYSGDGIVYVAGGKFNWLTLLSIKSVRALGSKLPIEVIIPTLDQYEADLCARVFPALNARCIYLPYVLGDGSSDSYVTKFKIDGYQYKALAVLVLSFENVLLLDSDNFPVHAPDFFFDSEPFKSLGLIVWPDFWKRATSPHYYKIAGIEVSQTQLSPLYDEGGGQYDDVKPNSAPLNLKEIPLHRRKGSIPDPTSESGQLMISKKSHIRPLLLALYYNLYGPKYYYPLFSQGSDGQGDKETFLAATTVLQKPFYQVGQFLIAFGYFDSHNDFKGTGMGQFDPVEDYLSIVKRKQAGTTSTDRDRPFEERPRVFFVHANHPKLEPWGLKKDGLIYDEKGSRLRMYGKGMKKRIGYDFEAAQWSNMKSLLCDLRIHVGLYENVDRDELCNEINAQLDYLKSTASSLE